MTVPNYVWFLIIPIFAGAIAPVVAQFYPTAEVFWSALLVAILGAIVSAIAAIKQVQQPAQPTPSASVYPPPPPADNTRFDGKPTAVPPAPKQRSYLGRMFIGA